MTRNQSIVLSLFLSSFAITTEAQAAEVEAGVTVGAGYSDNIRRVALGEENETIFSAGIDSAIFHDTTRWYANLLADLAYVDYRDNTYDSEVVGNADADLYWRIAPERFGWMLSDNFGQVRSDPFTPVTPDQRENVNYLTTGPDFTAAIGERSRLRLFGRFSNVDYQETPVDNNRYGAGTAFIREFSAASYFSINAQAERVEYKDVPANNYVIRQAYMRYRVGSSRTEFTMEGGYNDLKHEDDTRDNGPLARISLSRKLTAATTLSFSGGYELTDAALNFRTLEATQGSGASSSAIPQSNPFEHSYASVDWRFAKQRTSVSAGLAYSKESYLRSSLVDLDRTRKGANVAFTRRITANVTADLSGSYSREDLANSTNDEMAGRFGLGWALGQHYTISLRYEYYDRTSSIQLGEFREQRVWLQLRYGTQRIPLQTRTTHTAERW